MSEWPPTTADSDDQSWEVDDLQVGDLIFCAKSTGPLAELGRIADEPWRHVGIVDRDLEMRRSKGLIALQDHGKGCTVAFRNIRLKEIAAK